MTRPDPIRLLAAVDPLPAYDAAAERDAIWARIDAQLRPLPRPRRRVRPALVVAAAALALAVPALALSGKLGFSNRGTPVDKSAIGLRAASALDLTGATDTVRLLGSRAGVGFYLAHDRAGNLCFFLGPPDGLLRDRGLSGGCFRSAAPGAFPSPEQPVVDMSLFAYRPGAIGESVHRLAGVAADGVAKVEVLGMDCEAIAATPVVDNLYATTDVPDEPAAAIAGLDSAGKRVYLEKLRFWAHSTCAQKSPSTRAGS